MIITSQFKSKTTHTSYRGRVSVEIELVFEGKISNETLSGEEDMRMREHGDHTSFRARC
jgi:hypothetical protein